MDVLTRRTVLAEAAAVSGLLGLGAADALASALAGAAAGAGLPAPSLSHVHEPRPLPFDPAKLRGLSEKLLRSHWENNYTGAVKALNAVRGRLAGALRDPDLPPYLYTGLKREQLVRTGSVVYHEAYFGNLGGDGQPDAQTRQRIAASFGDYDTWETEFRRIAGGLAGGSGWAVLAWNPALGLLENYALADHAQAPAGAVPVLVLDMYEHAFHMDYGAAAARYVDAFFANIDWQACGRRLAAAGRPA